MGLYFEKQYFFCRTLNKKREPIDSIRAFLIMNSKLCINYCIDSLNCLLRRVLV